MALFFVGYPSLSPKQRVPGGHLRIKYVTFDRLFFVIRLLLSRKSFDFFKIKAYCGATI